METDNRLKIAPIFRRNLRPKPESPNLLMTLPPELRNRIYELYLLEAKTEFIYKPYRQSKYNVWREPPLLLVTKQIRHEIAPMFYRSMPFSIGNALDSARLTRHITKIRSVVTLCGPKPFAEVRISIGSGAWEKMGAILPFLELMRETGFEPAIEEYKQNVGSHLGRTTLRASPSSIFRVSSYAYGNLQRALEKAVALARRARDEHWSQVKLASEFATWKKRAKTSDGEKV